MARQAVIVLLCLYSAVASAQSAADAKIAANALFDEGKRLLAAGNVESACPKFEASLTLLDQLGTRLNLADCYERQGKTAAAWTEFREAASRAVQRGDDRAEFARKRAEALAPRLVKLQISVSVVNQVPNLRVRRDGADIPAEAFGSPLPVNPSSYTVEASAPGYVTWSSWWRFHGSEKRLSRPGSSRRSPTKEQARTCASIEARSASAVCWRSASGLVAW
jgi:tetratricopeptide (TPR) repeat protein